MLTVIPVKELMNGASVAPIGLTQMFNSGGAIKELKYEAAKSATLEMKARGSGVFGVYASARPNRVTVDSKEIDVNYDEVSGLVTFSLGLPEKELYLWNIFMEF